MKAFSERSTAEGRGGEGRRGVEWSGGGSGGTANGPKALCKTVDGNRFSSLVYSAKPRLLSRV